MTLEKIVLEFRKGLLQRRTSRGRCWFVCYPLQGYLSLLGHQTTVTEGRVSGEEHYWLTLPDKSIIDPTADQFRDPNGNKMPKVYIGKRPKWYKPSRAEGSNILEQIMYGTHTFT